MSQAISEATLTARLWRKVVSQGRRAGARLVLRALQLYYAFLDEETPGWAKAVIISALVYFVSPIDAIPDLLPAGYGDDLGVLMTAIFTVSQHVTSTHRQLAREQFER